MEFIDYLKDWYPKRLNVKVAIEVIAREEVTRDAPLTLLNADQMARMVMLRLGSKERGKPSPIPVVGNHRAAARCRSVRSLLPGRVSFSRLNVLKHFFNVRRNTQLLSNIL